MPESLLLHARSYHPPSAPPLDCERRTLQNLALIQSLLCAPRTLGTGIIHFLSIREPKRKRNLKLDNRDSLATKAAWSDASLPVPLTFLPVADDENKECCCVIVLHVCVIKSKQHHKKYFRFLLAVTFHTVPRQRVVRPSHTETSLSVCGGLASASRCIKVGAKHEHKWLHASVCLQSTMLQWRSDFRNSCSKYPGFEGRDSQPPHQGSHGACTSRGVWDWFLEPLFSGP